MKFIKPKTPKIEKVDWKVSIRTKWIVKYYSKYTGYTEDEIVDEFLGNLMEDSDFIEFLNSRRSKEKINNLILTGIKEEEEF